jgi:hypothetical protein
MMESCRSGGGPEPELPMSLTEIETREAGLVGRALPATAYDKRKRPAR